jgi:ABC-type amino acid transport substrate-binding protein
MRMVSVLVVALFVDTIKGLFEHRIYGAMNEFIDAHASVAMATLRPAIDWFVRTPFTILVAAFAAILLLAYLKSVPKRLEALEAAERPTSLQTGYPQGSETRSLYPISVAPVELDVLRRIKSEKSARVAFVHYPPFVAAAADDFDQPSGLYVDLTREFLQSEGIKPEFQQVRFSTAVQSIVDDKYDIILSIFETPKRKRFVDFAAFMHKVSVSGVVRRQECRIRSGSDLCSHDFKFVVFRDEIGHEILENQFRIPASRLNVLDGPNIAAMFDLVVQGSADVAIADSLSCYHGLAARGAEGPKLKPVLRKAPLDLRPNGVMIARNQDALGTWLDRGLKRLLAQPRFAAVESSILKEFQGIITKM